MIRMKHSLTVDLRGTTISRQFLTRNYPRPNCLLKCLPNCLSPTRGIIFSSFKITPAVRVIARQLRENICLAAFVSRHQGVSSGPQGSGIHIVSKMCKLTLDSHTLGTYLHSRTQNIFQDIVCHHSAVLCFTCKLSVEPKVRLQGYGYSPFCSHSSFCLEVLV